MNRSEAGRLGGEAARKTKTEAKNHRIEKYNKAPKKCAFCQSPLSYEKRRNTFCSHSCSQSYNNRGIVRNSKSGKFAKKQCEGCGKDTCNPKYCSNKCFQESRWQRMANEIEKSGCLPKVNGGGCYDYNPVIAKRYLAEKRGRKCQICGRKNWQNGLIPLVLDHIDGHAEDNRVNNLRLVCGNCNMLLPTFAGRNRGNGRESQGKKRNH